MTAKPAGALGPPVSTRSGSRSLLREVPILLLVALIIAIVIKTFVVQPFEIPSGSMQNTLDIGDKVLVNKLVYHFRPIRPGDVIVFDGTGSWDPASPAGPSPSLPARIYDDTLRKLFDAVGSLFGSPLNQTDYVKRVIGAPGDHVACCTAAGLITVNGIPLDERSYLYPGNQSGSAPASEPATFNVRVPAGYLWVLGDHRAISKDSRGHQADPGNGMVPENKVIGRAFAVAWPPSRWRILPIPATFDRPGIDGPRTAAAAAYLPAAGGFGGAIPVTWLYRRARRSRGRSGRQSLPKNRSKAVRDAEASMFSADPPAGIGSA